jgi:hypothetical protein
MTVIYEDLWLCKQGHISQGLQKHKFESMLYTYAIPITPDSYAIARMRGITTIWSTTCVG